MVIIKTYIKNEQIIQKMYDDNDLSSKDNNNRFLALSESVTENDTIEILKSEDKFDFSDDFKEDKRGNFVFT